MTIGQKLTPFILSSGNRALANCAKSPRMQREGPAWFPAAIRSPGRWGRNRPPRTSQPIFTKLGYFCRDVAKCFWNVKSGVGAEVRNARRTRKSQKFRAISRASIGKI